jgi:S-adenosylmethionine:tRNA ribosyltransferase-isomerase
MKKQELQYQFAESLIATEPAAVSRIFSALQDSSNSIGQTDEQAEEFKEINFEELLSKFSSGDILVLNDTKVLPRRLFTQSLPAKQIMPDKEGSVARENIQIPQKENEGVGNELEILFLSSADRIHWQVLFPAKKIKLGAKIALPGGLEMELLEKGLPQKVKCSLPLSEEYFEQYGDVPIPPYIQKVRNERKSKPQDKNWYQTHWANKGGSFAAPTASLHFKPHHLEQLKQKGVDIEKLTLHVGMGTFLPVHVEDLKDHQMHKEEVFISSDVWQKIQSARKSGGKVWALGTTVARALESIKQNKLKQCDAGFSGGTDLLILPGFKFEVVDYLLTNFHQPESTLLALVFAFAGQEKVKAGYAVAVEKKFRLFSYGDLSIWKRA